MTFTIDPPGYRPSRSYVEEVGHEFPDSSRPIGPLGVIRSFRTAGQQMWDEDFAAMQSWLNVYVGHWAHWWRTPRHPYYAPVSYRFMADPRQVGEENTWVVNGYEDDTIQITPFIAYPYQPWTGVKMTYAADRLVAAYDGQNWKGIAAWHHYKDCVEIAFFASEARPNRRIAAHTVQEPFFVYGDGRGCRVRGWPWQSSKQIDVERNGAKIGTAFKSQFSSGINFGGGGGKIVFEAGDVITLKTPDDYKGVRFAVAVSLLGGLL